MRGWKEKQTDGLLIYHTPLLPIPPPAIHPAIQEDGNMEDWMSNPLYGTVKDKGRFCLQLFTKPSSVRTKLKTFRFTAFVYKTSGDSLDCFF